MVSRGMSTVASPLPPPNPTGSAGRNPNCDLPPPPRAPAPRPPPFYTAPNQNLVQHAPDPSEEISRGRDLPRRSCQTHAGWGEEVGESRAGRGRSGVTEKGLSSTPSSKGLGSWCMLAAGDGGWRAERRTGCLDRGGRWSVETGLPPTGEGGSGGRGGRVGHGGSGLT